MASSSKANLPIFTVTGFLYGAEQARVEFDLVIPVDPPQLALDPKGAMAEYARIEIQQSMTELKSSYSLLCEFCGVKPARENYINNAFWLTLPPRGQPHRGKPSPGPTINTYIHAVCSMAGPCGDTARELSSMMAGMSGSKEKNYDPPHDGMIYPMNGSCAFCHTDSSASKQLMKCSRCKVIRYCNGECQKSDWSRHKTKCKYFVGARFVDPDEKVTVWKDNVDQRSPKKSEGD